ncbi:VCBS repeat-containing protein [bacterium]|nr:VCBS repeat-containing protein [bacterium]
MMIINNSAITMASQTHSTQQRSSKLAMRLWVGDTPPPPLPAFGQDAQTPPSVRAPIRDEVALSMEGRRRQQVQNDDCGCKGAKHTKNAEDMVSDPVQRMVILLMQEVLGTKFKVFDVEGEARATAEALENQLQVAQAGGNGNEGWGFELRMEESYYEAEQMSFAAQGTIQTGDGKSIAFQLELSMSREYFTQNSLHISLGDALTDPLVINFEGNAVQLSSQRFQFDLNSDGKPESIHFPTSASGFLALDKNADGQITQGSELFGPTTNDGFKELAAHDDDGNGWIDANDAIYGNLRILVQEETQQKLYTLQEKNIGALYLNAANTPFTIKDSQNTTLAQVAQSSIYVTADGGVGSMQRVDLAT